jgi:nucleotide-binding universal stress UspA family protein
VPGRYEEAPITPVPAWLAGLRDVALRLGVDTCVAEEQPGEPIGVLESRAEGAAMLVLGSYGEAAWSGMLAGSVALSLLERVRCPVAVIRGKAPHVPPPRGGPVVVGVDGSPAGRAALDVAAGMAQVLGARLVGTRAWSDVVAGSGGSAHRRPEDWPALAAEAEDLLSAELGRVAAVGDRARRRRGHAASGAARPGRHGAHDRRRAPGDRAADERAAVGDAARFDQPRPRRVRAVPGRGGRPRDGGRAARRRRRDLMSGS